MGSLNKMNEVQLGYCIGGKLDRSISGVGVIGKSPSVPLSDRELMAIFGSFGNGEVALQRFGIRPFPECGGIAYIIADPTQIKDRDGRRANLEFHIAFLHLSALPTKHNYLSIAREVYERLDKGKVSIIGLSKEIDQHRSGPVQFDDIELDTEASAIKAVQGRHKIIQRKLRRYKDAKTTLVGKANCKIDEFDQSISEFLITVDELACCGDLIEYFNLVSSFPDDRSSRDKIRQWDFIEKITYQIGFSEKESQSNWSPSPERLSDDYQNRLTIDNSLTEPVATFGSEFEGSENSNQELYKRTSTGGEHWSIETGSPDSTPVQKARADEVQQPLVWQLHKSRLALPDEPVFKNTHLDEIQVEIIIWVCSPTGSLDEAMRCRFNNYLKNNSEFCGVLKGVAQHWANKLPQKDKEDVRAKLRRIEQAFAV